MRPSMWNPARSQKGAVILWMTFFLIIMLGCIAVGIDMAKVMATRSQLQNAADAAALAGASGLNVGTGLIVPGIAKSRAYDVGVNNKAFTSDPVAVVIDTNSDVVVDNVAVPHTVWVKVRRQNAGGTGVIPYFSQVLGRTFYDVTAQATATVDYSSSVCRDLIPIAVQPDLLVPYQTGCAYEYNIKEGGGAGSTGSYGGIEFPDCENGPCNSMNSSGAALLRCQLGNGYACCIDIGDCLPPQQGAMSGPVRQGCVDRFSRDTDQRQNICYEGVNGYHGNGARVVVVPITSPPSGIGQGCYTVLRFAAFFLKAIPANGQNGAVTAEFIDYVEPGNGGGGSGTTFAVHLIR